MTFHNDSTLRLVRNPKVEDGLVERWMGESRVVTNGEIVGMGLARSGRLAA